MERKWWGKFTFLFLCVAIACAYVYPTFKDLDLKKTNFPIKQKITLGLDLQGGLYMVLGIDFKKLYREYLQRQMVSFDSQLKKANIAVKSSKLVAEGFPDEDPRIEFTLDAAQRDGIYQIFKDQFWFLRLTRDETGVLEFGLAHDQRVQIREKTIDQSIEVIRNRIDQFGVSEPSIVSQGTDRIVVELPGVREIERAKELIGRTAKLEFMIVDRKSMPLPELATLISSVEKEKNIVFEEGGSFSKYVDAINVAVKGKIPEGTIVAFERNEGETGKTIDRTPYLLKYPAPVTGEDLVDARVQFSADTNAPEVGFQMSPTGAVKFGKLTGANVGEGLAIVLDSIVYSAPNIQSQISERGVITLGTKGKDLYKEAQDLAIVLRAGALPAKLDFLEQRVVGSQLGADSIKKGTVAGLIGTLLVFLLIIFYYKVSGLIAALSLVLNVIFVIAILVGLEATLTLPGIAGIALTVGIAVDSNVVIYERIREELRSGKSLMGAMDSGFQKAFRTILDANITNAGAAIVLLNYGTGPIKGFAVTLLIGIITTLFSAVFITRLFFDLYLDRQLAKKADSFSI